nr:complexin-2 isoform X2 [Globicephala melas]
MTVWGIPPCLPLGFIHLCWRPLSSPSPAPASFFRKLGSPWERVCPWGRPLGSVPCSPTDIRVGSKRGSAAPACTCASPGRRERLCGEAQEVGEGETCQNLGPGRPGRPRRSCSLQQMLFPLPGRPVLFRCPLSLSSRLTLSEKPTLLPPGSEAPLANPPEGSCASLACYLLCSVTEVSPIRARPGSKDPVLLQLLPLPSWKEAIALQKQESSPL